MDGLCVFLFGCLVGDTYETRQFASYFFFKFTQRIAKGTFKFGIETSSVGQER